MVSEGTKATLLIIAWKKINDGWQYYCEIWNDDVDDPVVSGIATLAVTEAPLAIKSNPKSVTVKSGTKAKFTVKATGPSPQYQWFSRASESAPWEEVADATKATLTVTTSLKKSGTQYYCKVWNHDGTLSSDPAELTVTEVPLTIKTQPKETLTVRSGSKAKFAVKAVGPDIHYQWYSKAKGAEEWAEIEGANKASYSVKVTMVNNEWKYKCLVWNDDDKQETRESTLTVTPAPPKFSAHPKSITAKVGGTVLFKAKALGGEVTYQWYFRKTAESDWEVLDGETGPTLTVEGVTLEMNGWQYCCVASNAEGPTWSKPATLKVK
jgi:hypothetical protein